MQRIVHRNQRVDIDGNGFSAIGRLELNRFLQQLCADAGVRIEYERNIASVHDLSGFAGADLLVGADGANSIVRRALETEFAPKFEWLTNRFARYGTAQLFDCLSLTFRSNDHGSFVAHHYRHSQTMSTFVVECDEATWRRAGLDHMPDEESRVYCQAVFAPDLNGNPLVSNKSIWRQFLLLANRRWFVGNTLLIGDALRTVHFSIGSGTRLAFEDAIALDRAFGEGGGDVPRALTAFERERRPVVEKIVAAANASSYWYESLAVKVRSEVVGNPRMIVSTTGALTNRRLRKL